MSFTVIENDQIQRESNDTFADHVRFVARFTNERPLSYSADHRFDPAFIVKLIEDDLRVRGLIATSIAVDYNDNYNYPIAQTYCWHDEYKNLPSIPLFIWTSTPDFDLNLNFEPLLKRLSTADILKIIENDTGLREVIRKLSVDDADLNEIIAFVDDKIWVDELYVYSFFVNRRKITEWLMKNRALSVHIH